MKSRVQLERLSSKLETVRINEIVISYEAECISLRLSYKSDTSAPDFFHRRLLVRLLSKHMLCTLEVDKKSVHMKLKY